MSKGLIGRKVGMTRMFIQGNVSVPVTVIEAGPCPVTQLKTLEKDGYQAVQLGFGRAGHINKPKAGHLRAAGEPAIRVLKEFRLNGEAPAVGDEIKAELFSPGEKISITGVSKGKGFAGVMKRHGFGGGRATHGCLTHRSPGSIGCASDPSRVFPGRRMAGHAGARQVTVKNLTVIDVRPEYGVIVIKGAVPGPNGGVVFLRKN